MWGSGNAPRGADRAIKHPGRNLQPPIGGVARETAAENHPVSLLDHLMNVNTTPGPGMPWIKKLAFLGPVGVLSSCCSTPNVRTRRSTWTVRHSTTRRHRAPTLACLTSIIRSTTRPTITTCGRICYNRKKINLSQVFAGQTVGIKQVEDHIWLVSFVDYDLGYFDDETCRLEPLQNPFGPKVLPMSPV